MASQLPAELIDATLTICHALDLRRAARVCRAWRDWVRHAKGTELILLSAAGSNEVILVDVRSGAVIQRVRPLPPSKRGGRSRWSKLPTFSWPTCLASGASGQVFVSQYRLQGVLELRRTPEGFRYHRTVASHGRHSSPEGLVCAHNSLYVVSADHGTVSRLDMDGRLLETAESASDTFWTLWGMCRGPDNCLYIAAHVSEGGDYRVPTRTNSGCVMRCPLNADGSFLPYDAANQVWREDNRFDSELYASGGARCYGVVPGTNRDGLNRPSNPSFCRHGFLHISSFFGPLDEGQRSERLVFKFKIPYVPVDSRFKLRRGEHEYDLHLDQECRMGFLVTSPGDDESLDEPQEAPGGIATSLDGRVFAACHSPYPALVSLASCGCESLAGPYVWAAPECVPCGKVDVLVPAGVLDQANCVLPIDF